MGWKRFNFASDMRTRALTVLRPPRARTPAAAARYGARAGIVIDWRSKRRLRLRPRARSLRPTQPLDRELRQAERGDPAHRNPPE